MQHLENLLLVFRAFGFPYSPSSADETPLREFMTKLLDEEPSSDQMSSLRRLFFESHTRALTDVRRRAENNPDPGVPTRKLPTAERIARQKAQEDRLGGLIFNPTTIPSNHLVDLFVDMIETGVLVYVKPEACCNRAQEVEMVKRDLSVSTDAAGLLKLSSKSGDPTCEANSELKLRAAWQRRNLAMDLAGLASFETTECWTQFLFTQLMREQSKGFAKISLQQLLDCDRQLFIQASHITMGKLAADSQGVKPLDEVFQKLKDTTEILQYLTPLPAQRAHDPPPQGDNRPSKVARTEKPTKGQGKGKGGSGAAGPKPQLPDGCVTHDEDKRPLCFAYQSGKCKFKGPAGKRCARGYHKCYKKGCYRPRPYYLCNHSD